MSDQLAVLEAAVKAWEASPLLTDAGSPAVGTVSGVVLERLARETAILERLAVRRLALLDAINTQTGVYAERPTDGRFGGVLAHEKVAAQIAGPCHVTRQAAQGQLALAGEVHHRVPALGDALAAGQISVATAQMLAGETRHLSQDQARDVTAVVLESNQGHTTKQLKAKAKRVMVARSHLDPNLGAACAEKAEAERIARRRVTVINHSDGFTTLSATLTNVQAAHAEFAIAQAAYQLRQYDFTQGIEPRSENTARADAFCVFLKADLEEASTSNLTVGTDTPAIQSSGRKILPPRPVDLTITTSWEAMQAVSQAHHRQPAQVPGENSAPAVGENSAHMGGGENSAHMGGGENSAQAPRAEGAEALGALTQAEREMLAPGFISGIGDVNARDAAEAVLQLWGNRPVRVRFLIHDQDGQLIALSAATSRYQPDRLLGEAIRVRDLTCRWEGCQNPATYADLDHVIPYPVGPTHESNLVAFCRSHHRLKTHGDWKPKLNPANAHLTVTDPTGRQVITKPHSYLEPGPLKALKDSTSARPPLKDTG